jgi:cellulose synthase/poly-beta-1,6-N-acetylglucosamine synthase-like glycosyltransferase
MILDYLLASFLAFYLLQIAVFLFALRRPKDLVEISLQPIVSVVIAARNEQRHLAECLESVLHQSYPIDHFEVIVVNDQSTDRTELICQEFAGRFPNFGYLTAQEDQQLRGKTNALDQGVQRARGEIILITDADCEVPTTWVEWTAKRYVESVGIVGGITLQKATSWFDGMQSLDWAFLLGVAASSISLRIPLSTIGNNLSFRKSAYEDVGGYRKIPFSVTEDFMLFQAIVSSKKWDYLCPIDPRILVLSQPCSTWQDLYRQKHRWGRGGLDMKLSGMSIMAIGFGLDAFILIGLAFGQFAWAGAGLLLKVIGDYSFLHFLLKKQHRLDLLKYFASFEAYLLIYVLLLPFIVLLGGPVVWKGRTY